MLTPYWPTVNGSFGRGSDWHGFARFCADGTLPDIFLAADRKHVRARSHPARLRTLPLLTTASISCAGLSRDLNLSQSAVGSICARQ